MNGDWQLIESCKHNDSAAFEKLYKKYASKMKGVAYRYVNDFAIAEDILQEAFIKVFVNLKTFDNSGSFEGWLRRVVVNSSINYFHSLKKQSENISDLGYLLENDLNDEGDDEEYDYSMEELVDSISMLPEGYKMVFNMYVVDNFTHKEIAAALNITEGTSKSQLSKAREYLKRILEKQKMVSNGR